MLRIALAGHNRRGSARLAGLRLNDRLIVPHHRLERIYRMHRKGMLDDLAVLIVPRWVHIDDDLVQDVS